jgi:integrase
MLHPQLGCRRRSGRPAAVGAQRVNRLLAKAGAIGRNIEVAHGLRHGAEDLMFDDNVEDETQRLQMGHTPRRIAPN